MVASGGGGGMCPFYPPPPLRSGTDKGSMADLIGRFIPKYTVIWKKFSMKRNICPAGTCHTYVRKVNRLFSNLWSVKAVN